MKKLTTLFLIVSALFSLAGCKGDKVDLSRISQLREDLFMAETEDFIVYAYPEIKEIPFIADGYVGEKENVISFKITFPAGKTPKSSPAIEFSTGKEEYKAVFEYSPFASTLNAEIEVASLPIGNFSGRITIGEEKTEIEFISLKGKTLFSYEDAISLSISSKNETVKSFLKASTEYEIRVRLLENDGYNYWYVGLLSENGGVALLLDAETGEIIDVKKV